MKKSGIHIIDITKLIFARTNFREKILKSFFLYSQELIVAKKSTSYFARIIFREIGKKNI